jgi:hypothetical protein
MNASILTQPTIWQDLGSLITAPGGWILVLLAVLVLGACLVLVLDASHTTVRVHPLKPRKLPFFWEDIDDVTERSAGDILRDAKVVHISDRRIS